jgi:ubiquinone/menaquinone biosynthesis C-methylase UbiE
MLPELESLVKQTSTQVRNFARMAQEMTGYIPARLRARPIEFEDTFEQEGRELLTSFDATLGSRIYSRLRTAGFAFLGRAAMDALRGKTLLEVGCGSGQATAELWARMQGDIHITATDSVAGMLELARQNFATLLDEVDPSHPPLTEANRPVFEEASATELPYEDGTFDAVWSAFVLHWTRDPRQAIAEILRVLKPGGVVFGLQPIKPLADPYFDLAVRSNESSYGFFWAEELRSWFARHEVQFAHTTPITVFRGYKPDHQGVSSSDVS